MTVEPEPLGGRLDYGGGAIESLPSGGRSVSSLSMNIHQIQMVFDPGEDRILMRLSTLDQAEFRFWLTRRYVKLLWSVLMQRIDSDPQSSLPVSRDPHSRRVIMGFEQEQAVQNDSFSQDFNSHAAKLPLGESPVLLTRIALNPTADGQHIFSVHPEKGFGINITVDHHFVRKLIQLIVETVKQTDWNLALLSDTDFTPPGQSSGLLPHQLN